MIASKIKNIIVKDYIYDGHYIFGTFYEVREDKKGDIVTHYILDDGDIYTEKDLKDEGYDYIFVSSEDIIEAFKGRFK